MIRLILLGLLAGAFFSSTFVLNEVMSTAGGHWYWSASLRYFYMFLLISLIIVLRHGFGYLTQLSKVFFQHWQFWCLTGGIGFGVFYSGICFASDHISGWVVAATFMFTVVTSLLILMAFGQRFDKKFIIYAVLIFIGVLLVNVSEGLSAGTGSQLTATPLAETLLYGALPALIAAFSYPIGNQLVWQASYNSQNIATQQQRYLAQSTPTILQKLIQKIPSIETHLLQSAFNKIWLMTLGSLPFWAVMGLMIRPTLPESSQLFNAFLVALLAGVAATGLFLYAREEAKTSSEVAGVDATQASEVVFALIGGIVILNNPFPSAMGLLGIALIIIGLILFAKNG